MKKKTKKYRQHQNYLYRWLREGCYVGKLCETCGEKLIYLDQFDALCCPICNLWMEPVCGDPNCPFCSARPETPEEGLIREHCSRYKEYTVRKYEKRLKARSVEWKKVKNRNSE